MWSQTFNWSYLPNSKLDWNSQDSPESASSWGIPVLSQVIPPLHLSLSRLPSPKSRHNPPAFSQRQKSQKWTTRVRGHGTQEIKTESASNLSQGFLNYLEFLRRRRCKMLKGNVTLILEQKINMSIGTLPLSSSIRWRHTKAGDWGSNSTR